MVLTLPLIQIVGTTTALEELWRHRVNQTMSQHHVADPQLLHQS